MILLRFDGIFCGLKRSFGGGDLKGFLIGFDGVWDYPFGILWG